MDTKDRVGIERPCKDLVEMRAHIMDLVGSETHQVLCEDEAYQGPVRDIEVHEELDGDVHEGMGGEGGHHCQVTV